MKNHFSKKKFAFFFDNIKSIIIFVFCDALFRATHFTDIAQSPLNHHLGNERANIIHIGVEESVYSADFSLVYYGLW